MLRVDLVYATAKQQHHVSLMLEEGATVLEAIQRSGILLQCPEIDLNGENRVGIYGRVATLDTALKMHDRVEIYRPLQRDPKQARRLRAQQKSAE